MVMAGPGKGLGPPPATLFGNWWRRIRCWVLRKHSLVDITLQAGSGFRYTVTLKYCKRCHLILDATGARG